MTRPTFSGACNATLPCGCRTRFGSCGEPGTKGELTHQKDALVCACYDDFFKSVVPDIRLDHRPRILEIGICRGGSLAAWAQIEPAAEIVGVDNNLGQLMPWAVEHFAKHAPTRLIGANAVDAVRADIGAFDLAIDDGGHGPLAVFPVFAELWPKINRGGWYIIEDWEYDFNLPRELLWFCAERMIGDRRDENSGVGIRKIVATRTFLALEKKL